MTPFIANQFRRRQSSALGGVALIATLIALIVTDLISDGLTIDGIGNWLAATVIVWAASLIAAWILPSSASRSTWKRGARPTRNAALD
jgi:hypothetical protein